MDIEDIGGVLHLENFVSDLATHKLSEKDEKDENGNPKIHYFDDISHAKLMENLNKPSEDIIEFELKI